MKKREEIAGFWSFQKKILFMVVISLIPGIVSSNNGSAPSSQGNI